ncbi:hypothetical protein ACQRIU_005051 [Beauveria bassiana]
MLPAGHVAPGAMGAALDVTAPRRRLVLRPAAAVTAPILFLIRAVVLGPEPAGDQRSNANPSQHPGGPGEAAAAAAAAVAASDLLPISVSVRRTRPRSGAVRVSVRGGSRRGAGSGACGRDAFVFGPE